jgi:hypothetical protein
MNMPHDPGRQPADYRLPLPSTVMASKRHTTPTSSGRKRQAAGMNRVVVRHSTSSPYFPGIPPMSTRFAPVSKIGYFLGNLSSFSATAGRKVARREEAPVGFAPHKLVYGANR